MNSWHLPAGVLRCLDTLWAAGFTAYPVGGCVRDLLLGRTPGDFDICTSAKPEDTLTLFPHTVPTGLKHGTITVLTGDGAVEVTTFRREAGYTDGRHPDLVTFGVSLREDLSRRDFTINAMALAQTGEIIDPFGGQGDLRAGVIRCVGEPNQRFAEDALRMFRGLRFAAQLGFTIHPDTLAAIRRNAFRTGQVSGERIKAELEKMLLSPRPEWAGEAVRLGLLTHLWLDTSCPCLMELKKLPPQPIPRWRAFCLKTGFPIESLPVERALKQGVRHPERALVKTLALSGGELAALGLKGTEIGAAQRRLAAHVLRCPQDNTREKLLELLRRG